MKSWLLRPEVVNDLNELADDALPILAACITNYEPANLGLEEKRQLLKSVPDTDLQIVLDSAMLSWTHMPYDQPTPEQEEATLLIVRAILAKRLTKVIAPLILGQQPNLKTWDANMIELFLTFDLDRVLR